MKDYAESSGTFKKTHSLCNPKDLNPNPDTAANLWVIS